MSWRLMILSAILVLISADWVQNIGDNCYNGAGATDLEHPAGSPCGKMSVSACKTKCLSLSGCTGITCDKAGSNCFRRSNIDLTKCAKGDYGTYTISGPHPPTPAPPPSSPTPPPPGPPASECALQKGLRCHGNDIQNMPGAGASVCCGLCQNTTGCKAFTHDQYNQQGKKAPTCFMKSACSIRDPNANAVAGVLNSKPTPAAPSPAPAPTPRPHTSTTYTCSATAAGGRIYSELRRKQPNAYRRRP
jgi:hypothetical protein